VSYYLGIDGGGSKTTCVVGDDSAVLATATAGPSNVVRVGESQARKSIHQCIRQACAAASISLAQVTKSCMGAAGAAQPEVVAVVRRILVEVLLSPFEVVGDMQIALESAFGAGLGVIAIAGTGSICYGRDREGRIARAGGWGFAISDEGSAHWIGRAAISALLRAADEQGSPSHDLRESSSALELGLGKAWNIKSLHELASAANFTPPPDFALLFPAVLAAGDAGDELGRRILSSAGRELARLVDITMGRLFPETGPSLPGASPAFTKEKSVPLAMAGGVFRHSALVREVFYNESQRLQPRAMLAPQVVDPVEGALRRARSR
jgi:glucosamine kinase